MAQQTRDKTGENTMTSTPLSLNQEPPEGFVWFGGIVVPAVRSILARMEILTAAVGVDFEDLWRMREQEFPIQKLMSETPGRYTQSNGEPFPSQNRMDRIERALEQLTQAQVGATTRTNEQDQRIDRIVGILSTTTTRIEALERTVYTYIEDGTRQRREDREQNEQWRSEMLALRTEANRLFEQNRQILEELRRRG